MEPSKLKAKIVSQIQHMARNAVIRDRRFLDDEQLVRSEQLAVLDEVFNANVRDTEIRELSSHFAPMLRGGHSCHLALWGHPGTGKTLTTLYFLGLLNGMCREQNIAMRYEHLDLSTPRPCFRALNDLACLLDASKRYKKGISLEELMQRIEHALSRLTGYLVLFIDECDHVRRDRDTFMAFLVRRLPQRISAKLILVFASNRLDWPDQLDPRVRSFLKLNELIFKPYNAADLLQILRIRALKGLRPGALETGVLEKIAGLASRDHGDSRRAVALLAKSAFLAEKAGAHVTLDLVDQAAAALESDRSLALIRTAAPQLQAAFASLDRCYAVVTQPATLSAGEAYDAYMQFCNQFGMRILTSRAFADLVSELDMCGLVRARVTSRGRYGRSREISLPLEPELLSQGCAPQS